MKILIVHNRYREPGGEDLAVNSEIKLLRDFGHEVLVFESSNKEIQSFSFSEKMDFLINDIIWSNETYSQIKSLVKQQKPDVAHVHNIFYKISPSVYYALKEERVPVVQTLHNYRFICPNALLYRKGKICEKCFGGRFTHAFLNKCWQDSFLLSLSLARMLRMHIKRGTFTEKIDIFIALSEFSRNKYIEAGFPKEKIYIKPNFIDDEPIKREGFKDYALFIGRFEDYKGINTLICACRALKDFNFKLIGDGPQYPELKAKLENLKNIELLGRQPNEKTIDFIKNSSFLIFPSECYENMPRVIIESFANGVSVLASDRGAASEMIRDNITGKLFEPKNPSDLSAKIKFLFENKDLLLRLGENAYKDYRQNYTAERNYKILMDIYKKASHARTDS